MERATFNYIAKVLHDYPHIDQYIKDRELELMAPWREQDQNIGGGKASMSNGQEHMAITIADDRRLTNLQNRKLVVDKCLDKSDDLTVNIIQELYFKERPEYTVQGLADKLNLNDSTLRRHRGQFFKLIAEEIGL